MKILKEACVGSYPKAQRAYKSGADRIELCDNLLEGGTTPSFGTLKMAKKSLGIPIFSIIRPRGGNFVFSGIELSIMEHDIDVCRGMGIDGVVIGVLNPDNTIDTIAMERLIDRTGGEMDITFHMAFDSIKDKLGALDILVRLGVDRILTKGGETGAANNIGTLRELIRYAKGRIIILPGGGITAKNYMDIANKTGAVEVHGTKIV